MPAEYPECRWWRRGFTHNNILSTATESSASKYIEACQLPFYRKETLFIGGHRNPSGNRKSHRLVGGLSGYSNDVDTFSNRSNTETNVAQQISLSAMTDHSPDWTLQWQLFSFQNVIIRKDRLIGRSSHSTLLVLPLISVGVSWRRRDDKSMRLKNEFWDVAG